jgi:hypothetical protein
MIGLWQFLFRLIAGEPDVCGRCGGDILPGDVVVRARDVGPRTLWHRSCVFVSDEEVSAFRAGQRRKSQGRAIAADPQQALLWGGFPPESVRPEQRPDSAAENHGLVVNGDPNHRHHHTEPDLQLRRTRVDEGHEVAHGSSVAHGRPG